LIKTIVYQIYWQLIITAHSSRTNPFVWHKDNRQRIETRNLASWRGFLHFKTWVIGLFFLHKCYPYSSNKKKVLSIYAGKTSIAIAAIEQIKNLPSALAAASEFGEFLKSCAILHNEFIVQWRRR